MNQKSKPMFNTRTMITLAMLSTLAYLVMAVFRIPVVAFLKYEPKDVIITFAGLLYGPLPAVMVSLVVSLLEMVTVSTTSFIGFFMNVLSTCAYVCPIAILYKRRQTLQGALLGMGVGTVLMTGTMLLWNYFITPFFLHVPRAEVAAMLLPVFLPFNLLKGGINTALVILLYKPVVTALRRAGLVTDRPSTTPQKRLTPGAMLVAALVLVSCIMAILIYQGIL